MKYRVMVLITLLLFFAGGAFAQIEVNSTKKVYTRTAENLPDFKRTFEVSYPTVTGLQSESAKRNLDETLSYWKNFDLTLEESLADYTWLDSLDFAVNYNKDDLLGIDLIMEGSAAYPDGQVRTLVIDLKNGKRLGINDVFTNIGDLVLKIDKAQQAEIKQAKLDAIRDGTEEIDVEWLDTLLGDKRFSVKKLGDFSISDEGVTFLYDYGFPHVYKALQPDGRYFFTWSQLRPQLKRGGPFERFRR